MSTSHELKRIEPDQITYESLKPIAHPGPGQFVSDLTQAVAPFVGFGRKLEILGDQKALVLDATSKFLIRDRSGNPEWVVICSSARNSEMVAWGVQRAREIADALGHKLGRAVLLPVAQGRVYECSFAVFPYCTPLLGSGRWWWLRQRRTVRPRLVRWLLESTRRTAVAIADDQLESRVFQPLEQMQADRGHCLELRVLADEALRAARSGDWQPHHVAMHGDLWAGNVLLDRHSAADPEFGRFVIIDWSGSRLHGYPLYDLLRLAEWFELSGRAFFAALDDCCAALGCTRNEARYAFANAAAELGQRLEHWPRESYLAVIDRCYRKLMTGR